MKDHPRIQAQLNILYQLLAARPNENDFEPVGLAEWARIGMASRFYLYNGIEAYTNVIRRMIEDLQTEEQVWQAQKLQKGGPSE